MNLRTIIGLWVVMIACSCNQKLSNTGPEEQKTQSEAIDLSTGLNIENRVNRGARFTDSKGNDYWLIHIASTISNGNAIPIVSEIAFSKEYNFPIDYGSQKFNIFLLPQAFTLDGVPIITDQARLTDSMLIEFEKYIESGLDAPYKIVKTLEPGEKCVVAIGTQYPNPPKSCDIFPNVLFAVTDDDLYPTCNSLMVEKSTPTSRIQLGLKLNICPSGSQVVDGNNYSTGCMIIPCGRISFPDH